MKPPNDFFFLDRITLQELRIKESLFQNVIKCNRSEHGKINIERQRVGKSWRDKKVGKAEMKRERDRDGKN